LKLVVGLGNIGARYAHTRHNIGFMVIDRLASDTDGSWKTEARLKAEVAAVNIVDEKIVLAKPKTMMNMSGEAVQRTMQYYKIAPTDVWLIFDDLDVPFGKMRVRTGGMSGGHQGVNSTIQHIGANFVRIRLGISMNDRTVEPSEVYVLNPFNQDEQTNLPRIIQAASDIIRDSVVQPSPEDTTFTLI
jgi:PTH1 family peptidyl-tRNA hydrolase